MGSWIAVGVVSPPRSVTSVAARPGRSAVMCRNHRGFVEALLAGSRLGADLLLLNTEFAGPQLAQVLEREKPGTAILDEEFASAFDEAGFEGNRVLAWAEDNQAGTTFDSLIAAHESAKALPASDPNPGTPDHPHLRYDRDPEGRSTLAIGSLAARADDDVLLPRATPRPRADPDCAAALSWLRAHLPRGGDVPRRHDGGPAPVRCRSNTPRDRRAQGDDPDRRSRDAPADPRASG